MSNYTKSTNFATKDSLPSGDALKIVKGTEIDTEFNNIATAIATKADLASPTFTGTPTLPTGTIGTTQSAGNNSTALSTTAYTDAAVAAVKAALFPVGAIYTAVVSTNPGTLLGFGTWTAFGAGRVMVGFDASNALFNTAEETGGFYDAAVISHSHGFSGTTSTAGAHAHSQEAWDTGNSGTFATGNGTTGNYTTATASAGAHEHTYSGTTGDVGVSGTNANIQPYITVYMWKRTA